jgi:hypothetical protein
VTRWTSVLESTLYMTSMQTPRDMAKARKVLERKAAGGDATAAIALDEADVCLNVWQAYNDVIEEIKVDKPRKAVDVVGSADADLSETQTQLLNYFAQIKNFIAFWGLRFILGPAGGDNGVAHESASCIFSLTQGGTDWEPQLEGRVSKIVPTAVTAVTDLVVHLRALSTAAAVAALEKQLKEKLAENRDYVIKTHESNDEGLLENKAHFDQSDVPAFTAYYDKLASEGVALFTKTLGTAVAKMTKCEGLSKLESALDMLVISERFMLGKKPDELPEDDALMYAFLGVPAGLRSFAYPTRIRAAWAAHRGRWTKEAHGSMTPVQVHDYYKDCASAEATAALGTLARHHLLRPLSATPCERVFSFLTEMDRPNRRNAGRPLIINSLKLRGNKEVVAELVAAAAEDIRAAQFDARAVARKRNRAEADAAAAAAAEKLERKRRRADAAAAAAARAVMDDDGDDE